MGYYQITNSTTKRRVLPKIPSELKEFFHNFKNWAIVWDCRCTKLIVPKTGSIAHYFTASHKYSSTLIMIWLNFWWVFPMVKYICYWNWKHLEFFSTGNSIDGYHNSSYVYALRDRFLNLRLRFLNFLRQK